MVLFTLGRNFINDLETNGALAVYTPLEGGFEGRYQRRLRTKGYRTLNLTARGLGDLEAYLTGVHGVRPHNLGKRDTQTYFIPPIIDTQLAQLPAQGKGLVLWLMEGMILSGQELEYLTLLPQEFAKVKVVLEMGGARSFTWVPLNQLAA